MLALLRNYHELWFQNPKTLISHKVRMKSKKQRSLIPSRHSLWLRLRACERTQQVDHTLRPASYG